MMTNRERDLCDPCHCDLPHALLTGTLFSYEPPITKLILQLKFNHALVNARVLGELMADKIRHEWYLSKALPQLIVPVPLHSNRLKERGYNQSVEIARPITKALQIPIDLTPRRIKITQAQATLSPHKRKLNVKNAFEARRRYDGLHIAVLDDVITTGHTIEEFCRTLKKAGAERIDVWCCGRRSLYSGYVMPTTAHRF